MSDENLSIVDELDEALRSDSAEKRIETLRRIRDLFLSDADRLSAQRINVFDRVLQHMIERIEANTLAELSVLLSPLDNAPIGTIRELPRNDEISVAVPMLTKGQVKAAFDKPKKAEAERMLRFWKVRLSTSAAS